MEIGKKFYDAKRQRWFWTYTTEERELLRKQMMEKKHIILEVVKEERNGNYVYVTYNTGLVEKRKYQAPPSDSVCGIVGKDPRNHIPFNPNRGYDKDTFDWGNRYEN